MADQLCCAICGGPVGKDGRTLTPLRQLPQQVAAVAATVNVRDDDPYAHLTPGERFSRAIERRDALIRDRRNGGGGGGRRATDTPAKT